MRTAFQHRKLAVASLVVALVAMTAEAHDLYLMPSSFTVKPGQSLRIEVHNGDAFPESENAPHPERLRDAILHGRDGIAVPVTGLKMLDKTTIGTVQVPPTPGSLQLGIRTIPNLIALEPGAFSAYLREEGLTSVVDYRATHGESAAPGRERYSKFAKSLLHSGTSDDFYTQPLGFKIEIIPLTDPAILHPGQSLPVQVLFEGKPAVGLQIESAWVGTNGRKATVPAGRTDATGHLSVRLANAGLWRLHTIRMERCTDPAAADWESSWASLTFELR